MTFGFNIRGNELALWQKRIKRRERWPPRINLEIPKSKKQKWDFTLIADENILHYTTSGKRVNQNCIQIVQRRRRKTANPAWQVPKLYILKISHLRSSPWWHCCWTQSVRWANVRGLSGLEPAWVVVSKENQWDICHLFYTGKIFGSIFYTKNTRLKIF